MSDCYLPRLGGIERQVHDLAWHQRILGHEVEIITSVAARSPSDVDDLVVHRPTPRRERDAPGISYGASIAGRDAVLRGRYDVLHLHASTWSPLTYLTALAATRAGIPTVLTVHSLWSYAAPLFRIADAGAGWSSWPIIWSAVSSTAAAPLQRRVGPSRQVAILPNGVDPPAWRIDSGPRDPTRVVVASVGRFAERKRPRQLLRMLRGARERIPTAIQFEAIVIGDGPLRHALQRYLDHHGMSTWVHLVGPADHDEIRGLYRDVDFYVAPATLESFGIAALEARCAGLPVLAHARSGIADFISHGTEGLLADGDEQMSAMIAELANSPSLRAQIRSHNCATTPALGWSDIMSRCESLYQQAAEIPTGRRRRRESSRSALL